MKMQKRKSTVQRSMHSYFGAVEGKTDQRGVCDNEAS